MKYQIYKVQQMWGGEQCGEAAIVVAESEIKCIPLLTKEDSDETTKGFWNGSEITTLGWATGDMSERILGFELQERRSISDTDI